jgi:hypothetical protein
MSMETSTAGEDGGTCRTPAGEFTPLAQAEHLAPVSQIIETSGKAVAVSRSMTRSLSRSVSAEARRLRPPLACGSGPQVREEPRVVENGEVVSLLTSF